MATFVQNVSLREAIEVHVTFLLRIPPPHLREQLPNSLTIHSAVMHRLNHIAPRSGLIFCVARRPEPLHFLVHVTFLSVYREFLDKDHSVWHPYWTRQIHARLHRTRHCIVAGLSGTRSVPFRQDTFLYWLPALQSVTDQSVTRHFVVHLLAPRSEIAGADNLEQSSSGTVCCQFCSI